MSLGVDLVFGVEQPTTGSTNTDVYLGVRAMPYNRRSLMDIFGFAKTSGYVVALKLFALFGFFLATA
jgi:hypothetical protein